MSIGSRSARKRAKILRLIATTKRQKKRVWLTVAALEDALVKIRALKRRGAEAIAITPTKVFWFDPRVSAKDVARLLRNARKERQ